MSFHALVVTRDPLSEEETKTRSRIKRSRSSVGYDKFKSAVSQSLRISDFSAVKNIREKYQARTPKKSPRQRRYMA